MAVIGALTFYILQFVGKGIAYQWTITIIIFIGALLTEVPTTQQRFLDIIKKAVLYLFVQKEYIQDTRLKKGGNIANNIRSDSDNFINTKSVEKYKKHAKKRKNTKGK